MSKKSDKETAAEKTLYLIDISSFIFRAFFGIRALKNKSGEPTNAVYGVATMLMRIWEEAKPSHLAVVYDSKEPSFRKEIYEEYKANRTEPPDDLIPQFDRVEQLITAFEMPSFRMSGVEADDLIATLTRRWCAEDPEHEVVVVSSDKDLMQLVNERVRIWDTMTGKVYRDPEVIEKFGVRPDQIRDYLALVGDSSDNIPGVPGVGPKTASDLLREYETLDGVLKAAKAGKISGKKCQVIADNEKDALLSARLATVHEDLKVQAKASQLNYTFKVTPKCVALFKELDFHSLIQKWAQYGDGDVQAANASDALSSLDAGAEKKGDPTHERFRPIQTEAAFKKLVLELKKYSEFAIDLETTSLNPREAEIVGISLCVTPECGYYIPISHRGTDQPQLPLKLVLDALSPLLKDPKHKKLGQNLKYDCSVLLNHGIEVDGIGADTMVAAYVIDPEGRHNLETLAGHYLDYQVMTYESLCGKGKDQIGFDLVPVDQATRYSAEDAWITLKLWNVLKSKLQSEGLMQVFSEVDLPLVMVLTRMECAGVAIDVAWLKKLSTDFAREIRAIEEKVFAFTSAPINLNSPKQLANLLFDQLKLPHQGKTKTGFSTDAKVLETLAPLHEVPRLLLEYREIAKLKGTYVDPLPELRDEKTGRIHAGFHQTVTATGRLSSSDPNLQNIPIRSERGMKIRRAFIASPGNLLVAADYSQIELRLLAHMSGDVELVKSFKKDEDVHRRTASEIFGIPPEKIDDRQRGIAKAINFGLMYGKTAFGLSQELKISKSEAQSTIDRYFERYSGVKTYLDGLIEGAKRDGYVTTLLGRKRTLHDIRSANVMMRNNAERMAMNTPIQGTAADLMKLAMIEIDERLRAKKMKSKLIIQVHDEVVLDCPESEAKAVEKLVIDVMEGAVMGSVKLTVPLRVNAAIGKNWAEL